MTKIVHLALGGTIASMPSKPNAAAAAGGNEPAGGTSPQLTADEIAESIVGKLSRIELINEQFSQIPSPQITLSDVVRLIERIKEHTKAGAEGIVISQGTDTIEETCFALDLLWDKPVPIIVTGAMRSPTLAGAEGPANLLNAVRVAAAKEADNAGVLVVMNDEIHTARYVRKVHTTNVAAFRSDVIGPIGWLAEGDVRIPFKLENVSRIKYETTGFLKQLARFQSTVALVSMSMGDDGRVLRALPDLGIDAVIIEGLGGGHVTGAAAQEVKKLVAMMPVIIASRTGAGEVLTHTYNYPGSEIDLINMGAMPAGALSAPKAKVLLTLALAAGYTRDQYTELFSII